MNIWIRIFSLLTALEFFYIFYLETVAATSEKTSRVFAIPMETLKEDTVNVLLKNQGVYNDLIGVLILLAAFIFPSVMAVAILMLYIIGVAVYGGVSSQPKIILMQGGLPMITFILCLAALM